VAVTVVPGVGADAVVVASFGRDDDGDDTDDTDGDDTTATTSLDVLEHVVPIFGIYRRSWQANRTRCVTLLFRVEVSAIE
jgi:hypothetical protein